MGNRKIALNWPLVFLTTVSLYVLIILTLPFNALYASVLLFALIGYWSRLPGVGIHHPFFILYQMDVIDIFMIILAINLGPVPAIIFIWFCNMVSRVAGVYPDWSGVVQDGIILSITALVVPLLNIIVNGNLIAIVTIYSIFRPIGFFLFNFIWPRMSWPQRVITSIVAGGEVFLINIFYAKLFGGFFDGLLKKGVAFSWTLFIFATVIIFGAYITLYGIDSLTVKKKTARKVVKRVVNHFHEKHDREKQGVAHEDNEMKFIRESFDTDVNRVPQPHRDEYFRR